MPDTIQMISKIGFLPLVTSYLRGRFKLIKSSVLQCDKFFGKEETNNFSWLGWSLITRKASERGKDEFHQ